jgi:hypothetical protein
VLVGTIAERAIHRALGVREDAQIDHLTGDIPSILFCVILRDTDVHE